MLRMEEELVQHVLTMKNNFCPDEKSVDDTVKSPKTTHSRVALEGNMDHWQRVCTASPNHLSYTLLNS